MVVGGARGKEAGVLKHVAGADKQRHSSAWWCPLPHSCAAWACCGLMVWAHWHAHSQYAVVGSHGARRGGGALSRSLTVPLLAHTANPPPIRADPQCRAIVGSRRGELMPIRIKSRELSPRAARVCTCPRPLPVRHPRLMPAALPS